MDTYNDVETVLAEKNLLLHFEFEFHNDFINLHLRIVLNHSLSNTLSMNKFKQSIKFKISKFQNENTTQIVSDKSNEPLHSN